MRLRGIALAALCALLPAEAAASVTDRVDMANTRFFPDEELVPPLVERWSIPASIETLLAADGRVFVTDGAGAVAFDLATGQRLWATGFDYTAVTAYDRGVLYVRTATSLAALDAATGAFRWERPTRREPVPAGPIVAGDLVYVDADEVVTAYRAADGGEVWSTRIMSGTGGLATDGERIYAAGPCGEMLALDPATGARLWHHQVGCSGGGAARAAVHGGRVYHPEDEVQLRGGAHLERPVFDAATGAVLRHDAGQVPLFVDGLEIIEDFPERRGIDEASAEVRWRTSLRTTLDAPIAIGHDVYGWHGSELTAIAAEDGRVLWGEQPQSISSRDLPRLSAAAPGTLLTFSGGRLTAWESFFKPAPRAVALGASETDVKAGESVSLTGVLGRELRGVGVPVRVDGATLRGRFERFADLRAARDGGFTTTATVFRNSRFRVSAPGEGSEAVTVYANPTVVVGAPSGGFAGVSVRAPRTRLARRTLVLYRDPPGDRPLRRLAAGRLRATAPGRTRTRLRLRNRRGELVFCIRGQLELDLGRPDALNRRCGARRIRS